MPLIGWVDRFRPTFVAGWASETDEPDRPVAVDVYVGAEHAAQVVADCYRADLQQAGYGDGRKAFFCPLPTDRAHPIGVRVCFAGTQQIVPNGSFMLPAPRAAVADSPVNPWNTNNPFDYSVLWLGAHLCREYIYRTTTGDPGLHPTPHAIQKYILQRPDEELRNSRILLLGASDGNMERELGKHGFPGEVVATDIADAALTRAKAKSDALGYQNVRRFVHDLNEPMGDKFGGPFDFIFAEGVLHHIWNIDQCLAECDRLLKPDGLMFALEYEGPFRYQLSDLQVRWINAALNVLPRGLWPFQDGKDPQWPGSEEDNRRVQYVISPEETVAALDPSEALTGPDVKRLLPEVFEVVERRGFGGTILSYLTGHFDYKRSNSEPHSARWLKVLMEIEHALIETGILDDEFVFYVLKKRLKQRAAA
jgi:SAM-dependent methyltransferase